MAVSEFNFDSGFVIADKYKIISKLGGGWEGEVYLSKEVNTGIERTAKFFYPQRGGSAVAYAKKLYKVRDCPAIIQYHHSISTRFGAQDVTCVISEYVDGVILESYLETRRGKKLGEYEALHLLYALTKAVESLHELGEYHGDLHTGNIFVRRKGIFYDIKLIDLFDWKDSKRENMRKDVCDLVKIFYSLLGPNRTYSSLSPELKYLCGGLKSNIILKRFPNIKALRRHLEGLS